MANFKGFKQVFLSTYNGLTEDEKKGYLWLVRESVESDSPSAIYFGTRKYAVNNQNEAEAIEEKVTNIVNTLGDVVDPNGEWVGFLPIEEHELIGSATTMTEALTAIENAILENKDAIAAVEAALEDKVDTEAFNAKVTELEEEIENAGKVKDVIVNGVSVMSGDTAVIDLTGVEGDVETLETDVETVKEDIQGVKESLNTKASNEDLEDLANTVDSAVTAVEAALETKANAEDVYTKEEVDEKLAATFKFKGNAESVSEDMKTIVLEGGEEILAGEDNVGFVYQIGDAEYASNGTEWVKLGFNIDLTEYAKTEDVVSAVTAESQTREAAFNELSENVLVVESAITQETALREAEDAKINEALEGTNERVEKLESVASLTADTYDEAVEIAEGMNYGQIIYINNGEEGESGHTAGAYIYTQSGLKKLDTSTGDGSTVADRVEVLENVVGTTALPDGKTLTSAVSELLDDKTHEIDGDDVEE